MYKLYSLKNRFRSWLRRKMPYIMVIFLVLCMIVIFFSPHIVIVIHSGEAGVLYRLLTTGTDTDHIFKERVNFIWPWDTMYIYNVRVQTVRHELTVLTSQGLPITLSLAIRFRPEYDMLGLLHKNVGPDYIDKIIIPQIESVLRKNIGELLPEDIYSNKEGVLNKIMRLAIEETSRKYVIVDDIIIRSVTLPSLVRQAIEEKLVEQQILQRYTYKLKVAEKEAERKKIEADGIKNYQAIISKTISEPLIKWQAVQATQGLIESNNAKIVIIGAGEQGLPVILGNQWDSNPAPVFTTPMASPVPNESNELNELISPNETAAPTTPVITQTTQQ